LNSETIRLIKARKLTQTSFPSARVLFSDRLLVGFLSSGYIGVKNGGDPIRNPAALPTGLNLYGFDPSRVPTKAAYEQGKLLTEQLIADYYKNHKKYPDKLVFSLWSMETMRHYGVLESQVLYAMGVKPKWSPDGRVIGTEIIPASELKRPRVDVVLSVTGLYRDAFPNCVMRMRARPKMPRPFWPKNLEPGHCIHVGSNK
jgi:cobaltochelatase CobN